MKQVDSTGLRSRPVTVAVVAHKPYRVPDDDIYIPLHVGAALHPDILTDWIGDDTGENISESNPKYSELTGLYWLWKNDHAQYQGLVHYRRYFATASNITRLSSRDRYDRVIRKEELCELLSTTDIVLPRRRNYYIETIRSHYAHTFPAEHLSVTRAILASEAEEYVQTFDKVMGSTKAHMFNMFIMRRNLLDEYCTWLFPILKELEERIDDSGYSEFDMRYPGRVSEMLLDVWLYTNGYAYKELPVINAEPVNWFRKGGSFLLAKFARRKYSSSF